jgi:hypothetical protein
MTGLEYLLLGMVIMAVIAMILIGSRNTTYRS